MAARMVRGAAGYRLDWKGAKVQADMEMIASRVMVERMRVAEVAAKNRLWPGHGVDTGTMRARTHIAPGGWDWAAESIKPVPGGGGQMFSPASLQPAFIRGKYTIELGCGEWYTIFYHQKRDAFLRIPFDAAMRGFKAAVEREWRAAFR